MNISYESWGPGDEQIKASVTSANPVDHEENLRLLTAAVDSEGAVKIRAFWWLYGPGKPKRYWALLGERRLLTCRDIPTAVWAMDELKRFISEMDGVSLEE